jgi:glycosyltransferase involved in cell wall biosynthesis
VKKALFVHQGRLSFVEKDLDILRQEYDVEELLFRGPRDVPLLWHRLRKADFTFCWFAKLHAFFAVLFSRLLGKRSTVVAGGDDVVYAPEIEYGTLAFRWKRWCPLLALRHADLVLSVSRYNMREALDNAGIDMSKVRLVYHGFEPTRFAPQAGVTKEPLVLSVGGVDWERLRRKGYEIFVRSAGYVPQARFVLIGKWYDGAIDYLRSIASENVLFTGWISDAELLKWYSRAQVYVQASWHEAFGCSLAEAMLCKCVPVVSQRAALPEVVGDCGFYVDELTPEAAAHQIKEALASDLGQRARERIVQEFPLEKRREALLAAIDEVMSQ